MDRLESEEDILNIFKTIRYLISFDNVISITALDIDVIEKKLDNIDYIHKIFTVKYLMPHITKNDLANYYTVVIQKKFDIFEADIKLSKIINVKDKKTDKTILDIVKNFREIKNSYNDTYLFCNTLSKNNPYWYNNVDFEFIFIMNIIKSINFQMFNKIYNSERLNLTETELLEVNGSLAENLLKNKFPEILKEASTNIVALSSILTKLSKSHSLDENFYIYKYHKILGESK